MLLRFGRLRLRISFFFTAFLVLILAADVPEKPAVFFLSALLHEAGHLVCLLASGCRDLTVSLMPGGAAISGGAIGSLPLKNALLAVLAGPCVNLLLACALTVAGRAGAGVPADAAPVNLALGIGNLLPVSFLDGGRALALLLTEAGRASFLLRGQKTLDLLVIALLFLAASIASLLGRSPLFLWGIAVYCLFRTVSSRRRG